MRLVYLGSPEAAVPPLRALVAADHDLALVVTMPDRRRGRGGATSPTPVKSAALDLGLPVTDDLDRAGEVGAELGVVVAYGRIVPPGLLARLPMVNLHFSLLPRWRGAAPVERGLLAGDAETGVCLMEVEEGLDTGGVYGSVRRPLGPLDTADVVRADLARLGSSLLVDALADGLGDPVPQPTEGVTYAAKVTSEDLRIDWSGVAAQAHRQVRVGGAWTTFRGRRLKVLRAELLDDGHGGAGSGSPGAVDADLVVHCGRGRLRLVEVGPEGRRPTLAADWARGSRPAGEVLGR